jgi:hypothetical protein
VKPVCGELPRAEAARRAPSGFGEQSVEAGDLRLFAYMDDLKEEGDEQLDECGEHRRGSRNEQRHAYGV